MEHGRQHAVALMCMCSTTAELLWPQNSHCGPRVEQETSTLRANRQREYDDLKDKITPTLTNLYVPHALRVFKRSGMCTGTCALRNSLVACTYGGFVN